MNIVLVEPEIPQNTGNIARLCAATNCKLHLVKPLGFSVDDKYLKRAGLDYWHLVDIEYHENLQDFFSKYPDANYFYATTKAKQFYNEKQYGPNDFILFGKETAGLPKDLLEAKPERGIKLPMLKDARSLNLSNSAAIILYEALRQNNFPGLK
jgi:tRNA (cytidine/uridine-2'-O-)-methyltransferase